MNRLVTMAALATTAVLAAAPAPALAYYGADCDATDPLCFDRLPRDDTWERAIGLPAVPNYWEGDGVAVASIDTGVTTRTGTSAAGCGPASTSPRTRTASTASATARTSPA